MDVLVSGSINVNGEKTNLSGSPTTTHRQHIVRALHDGTQLATLTRMVLVDTGGSERDSTTSPSFSVTATSLVVSGTITATASYTIARIRLYAGTVLYFDTSVTEQKSVSSGDTVAASVSITLSGSGSFTGYSYVLDQLRPYYYDVLRGARSASALNITRIRIYIYNTTTRTTTYYDMTPTKSLSTDGLSLTMSFSLTLDFDWEGRNVEVYAGTARLWYWNLTGTPPTGSAGSTISYTETVSA